MKFLKVKCQKCDFTFVADSTNHHMDMCPVCGDYGVDLEEYGCRFIGDIKVVDRFNPPWYEDENDYHSALLSWLNDSDQEFELDKEPGGKLYIIKL